MSDKNKGLDFAAHPLVDAAWLAANLDAPGLRIIDSRWRGDGSANLLYQSGHIPGAVHLDWQTDLSYVRYGVDYLLLPPIRFTALMSSLGLGDDTRVIAYADQDYSGAARLWWALRYYGHNQVGVLNGGMDHWLAAGFPVETKTPIPAPVIFTPHPQPALLAKLPEIEAAIANPDRPVRLINTRPPEQFAGQAVWTPNGSLYLPQDLDWVAVKGRPMRGGHLPGAVHLVSSSLLDPLTWTFLEPDEILTRTQDLGIKPEERVITYCGCGLSASLGLFALHLAGFKDLALYDGSWEEWGRDPDKPIERSTSGSAGVVPGMLG